MTAEEEQALKAYCRELYLEGYNQAKQDLLEQAKIMDETDKRKEALQNERELNLDAFTKEVSADNQALLDAAREYKERTPFQYPNQLQPAYEAFKAGAKWDREQMIRDAVEVEVFDNWQYGKDADRIAQPAIKLRCPELKIGQKVKVIIVKD